MNKAREEKGRSGEEVPHMQRQSTAQTHTYSMVPCS